MIFHRQRGEERTRTALAARMRIGEFECEAMLLNASSRGVLAPIAEPPVRGTRVKLTIGDMELVGQVRWRGTDCCGIALRDPISVADLLHGHVASDASIREPRPLGGIGGMLRALVGERSALRFH